MTDRVARSILWVLCSRGVLQVMSFASTLMVARLLAPADYGVMALASMWIVITAHVAELGLGNAILQFPDLDDRELNACFWLISGLAVLGYVGLWLSAAAIGEWFETPALPAVLIAVGLTLPLAALRTVPETLLRKEVALDKVSQAEIVASLVGLPLVVTLAFAGAGVWALVSGALTTSVVQGILTFRFARWAPGIRMGGSRLPRMVRYSLACVGAKFCWAAYHEADTFVLGKTAGGAMLGIYSMAKQLAMLPLDKLGPMVNQIAAPVMAELQADRDAVGAALLRGFRIVAWATLPACLAIALLADDLVRVVLTEKWSPAVPIIYVLSAYTMTRSLAVLFPTVLLARYRAQTVFVYNVALLGVMPLAFWIGGQRAGAMGVAAAWTLVHPPAMIWLAHRALDEVNVSWRTLLRELSRPAVASLAMVLAIVVLNSALASWDGFSRLALTIPVAMAAFAGGLWRFGGAMHHELRELAVRLYRPLSPQRVSVGPFVPERHEAR